MKNRAMPLNFVALRPSHTWFRSQNAVLSNHIWNFYFFKSIMNEKIECWYPVYISPSDPYIVNKPGIDSLAIKAPMADSIDYSIFLDSKHLPRHCLISSSTRVMGVQAFFLYHSKWMSGWKFQMDLFYMILYLFTPSSKIPPIFSKIFSPMMSIPCTIHPKSSISLFS